MRARTKSEINKTGLSGKNNAEHLFCPNFAIGRYYRDLHHMRLSIHILLDIRKADDVGVLHRTGHGKSTQRSITEITFYNLHTASGIFRHKPRNFTVTSATYKPSITTKNRMNSSFSRIPSHSFQIVYRKFCTVSMIVGIIRKIHIYTVSTFSEFKVFICKAQSLYSTFATSLRILGKRSR